MSQARQARRPGGRRAPPPAAVEAPLHLAGLTYQLKWILCGKASCGRWHGPYWYAFWNDHGRTRCKYVGRKLPDEIRSAARPAAGGGTGSTISER